MRGSGHRSNRVRLRVQRLMLILSSTKNFHLLFYVNSTRRILKQKNKLICVWQLLADACILVCRLPEKSSYLRLPSFLFDNDSNDTADGHMCSTVRRNRLLDFALRLVVFDMTGYLGILDQSRFIFAFVDSQMLFGSGADE